MSATRVAVLVDGDNVSARHSTEILSRARKLGRVDVARVYAGAHPSCDWQAAPAYRLMHAGTGKNAADVLLCIDTMELALTAGLETFVVATSDGDFAHLAHRLRERGLHVLGLGEAKAPEGFRLACSEFEELNAVAQTVANQPDCKTGAHMFDRQIRMMIQKHSQKAAGMRVADLSREMKHAYGTQISAYPERTWRAYLSNRAELYDLDARGPDAKVRYRPEGFAALPL